MEVRIRLQRAGKPANKRHNYRLYIPKKKDDIPEKDDDE